MHADKRGWTLVEDEDGDKRYTKRSLRAVVCEERNMNEKMLGKFVKDLLEECEWHVLPEFGVLSYEGIKQVDLAAFRWQKNNEVHAVAVECKYKGTARESFLAALGQALEYQLFFPEVFIATQSGKFFPDQESVLERLGLGYMMINEKGELEGGVKPSLHKNRSLDRDLFIEQVRNRAVILLVFSELFPEAYEKRWFGGTKQGELWIHNRPKNMVQFRAWSGIGRDSFFGINVESISLIRNFVKNVDVGQLAEIFSKLPSDYLVDLAERATVQGKNGYRILDRQKGSIAIRGSIFGENGFPACNLTKEQIRNEIIERSKKLGHYVHLLIDKRIWNLKNKFSKDEYLNKMLKAKETLDESYSELMNWST